MKPVKQNLTSDSPELDLSALVKACASFDESLVVFARYQQQSNDDALVRTLRAGVIQHFEFTYELCWKFIKRWLEINLGRVEVEGVSRRELFRLANESRLIDDVALWMTFHAARNQTSHAYDPLTAEEVFAVANLFRPEAQALLNRLIRKND